MVAYADYTRNTTQPLKRIAHARRYKQIVSSIAAPLASDVVLDYGCADAHLFSYFIGRMPRSKLVGYDPNPNLLAEASIAVREGAQLTSDIEQLKKHRPFGFSLIYCTEVCEHLTDRANMELFANIKALAAPHARIVFGVPIETGPSGFIKSLYRQARGIEAKSVPRALKSLLGMTIRRETTASEWYGPHTGFNHAQFRDALLASGFTIKRTRHLPLMLMRAALNNEIYFVCSSI